MDRAAGRFQQMVRQEHPARVFTRHATNKGSCIWFQAEFASRGFDRDFNAYFVSLPLPPLPLPFGGQNPLDLDLALRRPLAS